MKKDYRKQLKNELKQQAEALRFQTSFKSKTAYPQMTDEVQARINLELEWYISHRFAKGMLQLKEIADVARERFDCRIGSDHGILAGSVLGYVLGVTGADPMEKNVIASIFTAETAAPSCINLSLHLDPEKRNEVVAWAAEHFQSPAMTRMGVYIIKLDNMIVEFHRNMKGV